MPLRATVSRVVAGRGKLWIGVRVQPGDVVRPGAAPLRAGASGVGVPEPEASGR